MNISKQVEDAPTTIFDSFKIVIDARSGGADLKNQLSELIASYGTLNKLATNALFLYEKAKSRYDRAESIAWSSPILYDMKVTQQKIAVRTIPIQVDGEETTLNNELDLLNLYEYVYNRGKDKTKEIAAAIDIGRSLLSWEKMAAEKSM